MKKQKKEPAFGSYRIADEKEIELAEIGRLAIKCFLANADANQAVSDRIDADREFQAALEKIARQQGKTLR
jgi:hypothetical protein